MALVDTGSSNHVRYPEEQDNEHELATANVDCAFGGSTSVKIDSFNELLTERGTQQFLSVGKCVRIGGLSFLRNVSGATLLDPIQKVTYKCLVFNDVAYITIKQFNEIRKNLRKHVKLPKNVNYRVWLAEQISAPSDDADDILLPSPETVTETRANVNMAINSVKSTIMNDICFKEQVFELNKDINFDSHYNKPICFVSTVYFKEKHAICGHYPAKSDCKICKLAGIRRKNHKKTAPGMHSRGVLSVDLSGPHHRTRKGEQYFMVVVYTDQNGSRPGLPYVRILNSKNSVDVKRAIHCMASQINADFCQKAVFRLHSDLGGNSSISMSKKCARMNMPSRHLQLGMIRPAMVLLR